MRWNPAHFSAWSFFVFVPVLLLRRIASLLIHRTFKCYLIMFISTRYMLISISLNLALNLHSQSFDQNQNDLKGNALALTLTLCRVYVWLFIPETLLWCVCIFCVYVFMCVFIIKRKFGCLRFIICTETLNPTVCLKRCTTPFTYFFVFSQHPLIRRSRHTL